MVKDTPPLKGYTGRDNLEVMLEAVHYNGFLLDLVTACIGKNPLSILDFGAGSGTFCVPLRDKGYRVRCVEPDMVLSQALQDKGFSVLPDISGIDDESLDFIYSFNVLEHIEDDEEVIRQWYEKLRAGGRLLAYVPAFDVLYSSMDAKVGHFRRYRKKFLTRKFVDAGFTVDGSHYADCLGFVVALLYKYLGPKNGSINSAAVRWYDRVLFPLSRVLDRFFERFLGKNVFVYASKRWTGSRS